MGHWSFDDFRHSLSWLQPDEQTPVHDDPAEWCESIGLELYSVQQKVLRRAMEVPRLNCVSCNGSGKSHAVGALAAWHVAKYRKRGKVVLVAPSARQLRTNLLPHVIGNLDRVSVRDMSVLKENVYIGEHVALQAVALSSYTNTATGLGAHAPHILVILEECGGLTPPMLRQIITYTTGANGHIVSIGNPQVGSPQEEWSRSPLWDTMQIKAFDAPAFTGEDVSDSLRNVLVGHEFVETIKSEYGEDSEEYRSMVLGEFSDTAGLLFFSPAAVDQAFSAAEDADEFVIAGPPVIGFDVAGAGADHNELTATWPISGLRSGQETLIKFYSKIVTPKPLRAHKKPEEAGKMAAARALELGATLMRIDSLGPGAEAIKGAILAADGRLKITPVNPGRPANNNEKFANRRTEMGSTLRQRLFHANIALARDPMLRQELLAYERVPPLSGREIMQKKDDVKTKIGRSPDKLDSNLLSQVGKRAKISGGL